jgi:uncharacterized protein YecT (DUF1311 family)
MIRHAVAAICMLTLMPIGLARASEIDSVFKICASEDSHADMRACLEKRASESDAALISAEKTLLENISKRHEDIDYIQAMKAAFQLSRKSYKDYRDKQCEMYASMAAGGNAAGDLRFACAIVLNNMQIEQLDWISHNWR